VLSEAKSADWKVAAAAWLKGRSLRGNGWLSSRLNMGTDSGVSRYVRELKEGKRSEAAKLLMELENAKIHS